MSSPMLIAHGTVLTFGEPCRLLEGHGVLIEGDRITRIAPTEAFGTFHGRVLDARNQVVMPGLINAHMHFYSTFARGIGGLAPSANFQEVLRNLWWRLDRALDLEAVELSAHTVLFDAIRRGCTTLVDHHASPCAVTGSLDAIARAVKAVGLRACLCYEVSDRDGEAIAAAGLEENADFIRRTNHARDPQLRALFGLHASFTVGERTLAQAAERARDLDVGIHIHAAEDASDQEACAEVHGQRVVTRLYQAGLLGPQSLVAHAVHVNAAERALLAETGTWVAHNPQSNLNNAVGIADVVGLVDAGVRVLLGTDAMTTGMLEELRVALWAQHWGQRNPSCGWMELTRALTVENPEWASHLWQDRLGVLEEGALADVILVDYEPPTPFTAPNAMGHLVFGLSQRPVDTTIAGGRILMERGRLAPELEEARVASASRLACARVWEALAR